MIEIKAEYHNTAVAFGSSGAVLSKRSQSDLLDLAIMAQDSKNPNLIKLFVELPSLDELRNMKMREKIQKINAEKKVTTKTKKVETTKK